MARDGGTEAILDVPNQTISLFDGRQCYCTSSLLMFVFVESFFLFLQHQSR